MGKKFGKMVIVGAGHVGSAVLNSILRMNIMNEIVMVNRSHDRALGEVLDASHTTAFAYSANAIVRVGDYSDCRDAQIITITAGPSIKPGNSRDRMILLEQNIGVIRDVMARIARQTNEAILIVASNPLDILVHLAHREFGYPKGRIIGTGTLLDTARFNKIIGEKCRVDAKNVTGFVLGEHGSRAFIPWNTVNIVGVPLNEFERQFALPKPLDREEILNEVKTVGLNIVELKGHTSSGVALSACRIAAAVVRNERCVIPVSVVLDGQHGYGEVALSLPCVVSEQGIDRILELPLDVPAQQELQDCVDYLKKIISSIVV